MKCKMVLVNQTSFKTEALEEIANALMQGQECPPFLLIVQTLQHDGFVITGMDKPVMVLLPKDLHHFAKLFVHELVHLQQQAKGYVDEKEADLKEYEFVVSGGIKKEASQGEKGEKRE